MVLVIGAASKIAQALIELYAERDQVIAISRSAPTCKANNVEYLTSDYSEKHIQQMCQTVIEKFGVPDKVFICIGTLHNDQFFPEKRLEDVSQNYFEYTHKVNFIIPSLWLSCLCSNLPKTSETTIATLSARVGSISDNRLGGWYAYRSSKAALNMFIQTLSIELARRVKGASLLAFHPGTTDTPLSKPFQARVAKEKLFTPEFVARQLSSILDSFKYQGSAHFIDWAGKPIPW